MSLLKKKMREYELKNELLARENQLLKQQVRVLKGRYGAKWKIEWC
jgi:hypothetical protein